MSGIETRLQGFNKSYSDITGTIKNNVGASPYVKQTVVLENLSNLVKQGIAYNVEQRAFLASVSDKIATTFSAFDSSLLRIIRIQQADTTAARLGMESSLTKYFNEMFSDTSYLSDTFDSVSEILLESSSQLNEKQSVAYEYAVQKWLGSMGSVGVSSSTLQSLAQGLSYLGTGDISSLSSNESLQRLLVTAGGENYANILSNGLDAESANALLQNIVSFAQQIGSIDNNVVRQQYASLFGFTLSDITAIMKLTSQDLTDIASNMLTYEQAVQETTDGLATIGERMSIKEKIDTAVSNVMTSVGEGIASSTVAYTSWLVADFLENSVNGLPINIPLLGQIKTSDVMKTALVGYGLIDSISAVVGTLTSGGKLDLGNWGASDYNTRGNGMSYLSTTGVSSGLSQSTFIGNQSTSTLYQESIASAESQQQTYSAATGEDEDLTAIVRDRIANKVDDIYSLLAAGIKVKMDDNYNFGG